MAPGPEPWFGSCLESVLLPVSATLSDVMANTPWLSSKGWAGRHCLDFDSSMLRVSGSTPTSRPYNRCAKGLGLQGSRQVLVQRAHQPDSLRFIPLSRRICCYGKSGNGHSTRRTATLDMSTLCRNQRRCTSPRDQPDASPARRSEPTTLASYALLKPEFLDPPA